MAVNPHIIDRHVDVGWEDSDEQKRQPPATESLNQTHRDQQPDAAEKLAHAADDDARPGKGNRRWHDLQEELRMA